MTLKVPEVTDYTIFIIDLEVSVPDVNVGASVIETSVLCSTELEVKVEEGKSNTCFNFAP